MNSKILLLSVAVIAVGLFAMPSTLSLFSGQHTFYDGVNVSCAKCHQDIEDEIKSTANEVHTSMDTCEGCHRTETSWYSNTSTGADIKNSTWRLSNVSNVSIKAHAAVTVECLACHGKYNSSKKWGVAEQIQSASEAHRDFYWGSVSDKEIGDINYSSIAAAQGAAGASVSPSWYDTAGPANQTVIKLKGTNTACVGCHTHAAVNITWTRSTGFGMVVLANTTSGKLEIDSWSINESTNTTYTNGS
ncbi:MAG: multiheme c-type cytochrome [Candidatus Methanoperedens sp.]|nr:multiheme c-type cytochrome [Candidatus Methanoperedens sp.]PKL53513.1 MAG: hypothetical protein CVV36_06695 [Candidatus Methanoperedenaceae archaeon HGW-Methanoperedenaceae-1]